MEYRVINIRNIEKETWKAWFSQANSQLQEKISCYRLTEDQMRCLCGHHLAREMLSEKLGCSPLSLEFSRTEKGKPYLVNGNWHFNISHSGNFVACAIAKNPIGIDIEELRSVKESLCKKVCTEEELSFVYSDGEFSSRQFLQLWTAKEAVLKQIGIGISPDLSHFPVWKEGSFSYPPLQIAQVTKDNYVLTVAYKNTDR